MKHPSVHQLKRLNARMHVRNLHLKTSPCQIKLLREEIFVKKSQVKTFERDFIVLKRKLRETLGSVDYTHICFLFLNKKNRKLKHQQDIHSKKLFDLGFENSQTAHDPDRVIFNYSSHVLTESEKSLLCKDLNPQAGIHPPLQNQTMQWEVWIIICNF